MQSHASGESQILFLVYIPMRYLTNSPKIMTSTLPRDLQNVRDRLSKFDSEVPDIFPNEKTQNNYRPHDDSYTASLAERILSAGLNSPLRSSSLVVSAAGGTQNPGEIFHLPEILRTEHRNRVQP